MSQVYLMSQLPSLDGVSEHTPPAITEERFLELCHRFLGKKEWEELEKLTLVPEREGTRSSSALIQAWNEGERCLRLALGRARAEKLNKHFEAEESVLPLELVRLVSTAMEQQSPLVAEKLLNDYRLGFLETLRPTDPFGQEFVFYYALRLKLLLRSRQFDAVLGEQAYRNIYRSVVSGEELEAEQ